VQAHVPVVQAQTLTFVLVQVIKISVQVIKIDVQVMKISVQGVNK
jgi:hypothetical protein